MMGKLHNFARMDEASCDITTKEANSMRDVQMTNEQEKDDSNTSTVQVEEDDGAASMLDCVLDCALDCAQVEVALDETDSAVSDKPDEKLVMDKMDAFSLTTNDKKKGALSIISHTASSSFCPWESSQKTMPSTDRRTERPCLKLSVHMIKTYKKINEVYYAAKRKQKEENARGIYNGGADDENGYYLTVSGETIGDRYTVEKTIGRGSYGSVVAAYDTQTSTNVAIKIVKNHPFFTNMANAEVRILRMIGKAETDDGSSLCVKFLDTFTHKKHRMIVFERLSYNLWDVLRSSDSKGVSLNIIRKFARHILHGLQLFHKVKVLHCDLKPENIMLCAPSKDLDIKLIDFGSSQLVGENDEMLTYLQSRFYRSPEVVLELPYNYAIDVWSTACILFEMHVGVPLFFAHDEHELIERMMLVLGPLPESMLDRGKKTSTFFSKNDGGAFQLKKQTCPDRSAKKIEEYMPMQMRRGQDGHSGRDYADFCDLLRGMLRYDDKERLTPEQALEHPFLRTDSVASVASVAS